MTPEDIPSPIDLRAAKDAREWADTAMVKRPWRTEFFDGFATAIAAHCALDADVLELGSGPGFLAHHLLARQPRLSYVALDFSAAMHDLARERLGTMADTVKFVERSFKSPGWQEGLGKFDCVVTHQAVHELRHKRHVPLLHAQVRSILNDGGGCYLVCDHLVGEGGMADDQLYMTQDEQREALRVAGFTTVETLLVKNGLALHRAST